MYISTILAKRKAISYFLTHEGLVPATSRGDKSDRVNKSFLPQNLNSNCFEDLRQVHAIWASHCDQIKINQSQISITSSHNSLRTLFWDSLHEYNLVPMAHFLGFRPRKQWKSALGTKLIWALKILIEFLPLFVFVLATSNRSDKTLFSTYIRTESETIQAVNNFAE